MVNDQSVDDRNGPSWLWSWTRTIQLVNLLTMSLLLTPITLELLFGLPVVLQTTTTAMGHDYMHSLRPFLPNVFIHWIFPSLPIPIQTLRLSTTAKTTVYFPGTALDCVLGMIQGLVMGTDLLFFTSTKRSKAQTPTRVGGGIHCRTFPALAFYFYATMCLAALPIHCFKDVPIFDVENQSSLVASFCMWLDTFSTVSSATMVVISLLLELGHFSPNKKINKNKNNNVDDEDKRVATRWAILLLSVFGTIVFFGVVFRNRWIMFAMHIVLLLNLLLVALALLVYHFLVEWGPSSCRHGWPEIVVANVLFVVAGLPLLMAGLNASRASKWTTGNYCVLTAFFVASRVVLVQYWAFVKAQSQRTCVATRVSASRAKQN